MPIYEYACTACDHRTDILHGLNDPGPTFCPSCGAEATMRKLFAPPTVHYKGSGWAKKDRGTARAGTKPKAASDTPAGETATQSTPASTTSSDTSSRPSSDTSSTPSGGD